MLLQQQQCLNTAPCGFEQTRYGSQNLMTVQKQKRFESPTMTPDGHSRKQPAHASNETIMSPPLYNNNNAATVKQQSSRASTMTTTTATTNTTITTTKLFAPIQTNAADPAWMADKRLTRSKVFMARFHKAAVVLQKYARRYLQRNALVQAREQAAAIRMQAAARGKLQRQRYAAGKIVVKIQAVARGWHARRWHQVTVLEHKLDKIEWQKQQDLAAIEVWKEQERQKILQEQKKISKRVRKQVEKVEQMNEEILQLREENKLLRQANAQLQKEMKVLVHDNVALTKAYKQLRKHKKTLKKRVRDLETRIPQFVDVLRQLVERRKHYRQAIQEAKDYYVFEQKARHIFLDSVSEVLRHIHDQCKDKKLAEECINMALDQTEAFDE